MSITGTIVTQDPTEDHPVPITGTIVTQDPAEDHPVPITGTIVTRDLTKDQCTLTTKPKEKMHATVLVQKQHNLKLALIKIVISETGGNGSRRHTHRQKHR